MSLERLPESPWSRPAEDVARDLEVDPATGLAADEAERRFEQFGPNRLQEARGRSPLTMFLAQFADLMIGLLAAAAVVSAIIGEGPDAILIAIIVVANAVIGFFQEWRAERAVEALKELSQPTAAVRRDGKVEEIPATNVVPGDVVLLSGGDFVPADGRLLESSELMTGEAPLTGESLPIEKSAQPVEEDAAVADRTSMVFAGTSVTSGTAEVVVTATGMRTELGQIASLLEEAEDVETPLQRRLAALSKRLALIVIGVCVVVFLAGVLREDVSDWNQELLARMLLVAVSLAVAAIPEGLPAVITVALSLGSRKMANRNAIVRRLNAVETLGSVDVICSDKTGTLTQNEMAVQDVVVPDDSAEGRRRVLIAGTLCNDAELNADGELVGTATEAAFVRAAIDDGVDVEELRRSHPRLDEIPFSSDRKRMTTLHRRPDGGNVVYVKGAVERVLELSERIAEGDDPVSLEEDARQEWSERGTELANRGRRTLAVSEREWDGDSLPDEDEGGVTGQVFLGMVGIVDPVRPEARQSVAKCHSAGIRTVMITGDHPGTARAIGEELGMWEEGDEVLSGPELDQMDDDELRDHVRRVTVFARVTPEHKLRIVRAWQAHGSVVAMTGDGVNDAPALKQADIGVAMGITGTDVARESSEMVLADDNFATIEAAVEEGRTVYDNIRKFVHHLLSTNSGEILVLLTSILAGFPLPLVPVQILWINLITDGLPALALGFEPAEPDVMERKPRSRDESIFAGGLGWQIVLIGVLMATCCVSLYAWVLHRDAGEENVLTRARTLCFLVLCLLQLFYVLAIRSEKESFFRTNQFRNPLLLAAVLAGAGLQLSVVYVPFAQRFFHTTALSATDLAVGLGASTVAFFAAEALKLMRRIRG